VLVWHTDSPRHRVPRGQPARPATVRRRATCSRVPRGAVARPPTRPARDARLRRALASRTRSTCCTCACRACSPTTRTGPVPAQIAAAWARGTRTSSSVHEPRLLRAARRGARRRARDVPRRLGRLVPTARLGRPRSASTAVPRRQYGRHRRCVMADAPTGADPELGRRSRASTSAWPCSTAHLVRRPPRGRRARGRGSPAAVESRPRSRSKLDRAEALHGQPAPASGRRPRLDPRASPSGRARADLVEPSADGARHGTSRLAVVDVGAASGAARARHAGRA
jgi:hypothetical protein